MTQKEKIELEFAKLAVKKFDDYKQALSDNKIVGDREFKHMINAIYGCKIILLGIVNEGEKFKVELND